MITLPADFKLIVSFLGGSHLYGTNTPLSDEDLRGVFIPPKEYILGFDKRVEQFEDKQEDSSYYELRKFFHLACNNNPNIIEFLFVPENKWITSSPIWKEIISNRHYFLSTKTKHTFLGYAHSQFGRIKRHRNWLLHPPKALPKRSDFGLPDDRSIVHKEQLNAFNKLLSLYLEEIKDYHPLREQIEEMLLQYDFTALLQTCKSFDADCVKTIMPDISDNLIRSVERENAYRIAKREWDAYQNWKKNRNPERAKLEEKYGYDTKHGSHLYRLITEGEELLTTGHITFPRPDAEYLLEIENGILPYDEMYSMIEGYELKFQELYETSPLPKTPNRGELDKLCIAIIEDNLSVYKNKSCPCMWLEPCKPTCTCANPMMSGGCDRCASYGSIDQRVKAAERISNMLSKGK